MKKFIAFIAIIGIAFSACNGRYTVAKRKYNKGFYVSKSTGNSTKSVATSKPVRTVEPAEKIETVVVAKTTTEENKIEIAPIRTIAEPTAASSNVKGNRTANDGVVASTSKNNYTPSAEIKPIKIDSQKAASAKKGGDSNLVLMIILALFPILCLIAVYLHDGKVTVNFWIDLLLHLTIIGEIIFALLVVLDVIDLS